MSITLADQYYLKALDDYDYNFTEVLENLNYALSYDAEHAGANYLMGRVYMEQFQKFDIAESYFQLAMAADPENIQTCESLAWLMIRTKRFDDALRLIAYAVGLKGVIFPEWLRLKALIFELRKDYQLAKTLLHEAISESYDSNYIEFLEGELERIEKKERLLSHVQYHMA
ncbi:tetratricopeptide repeat protein [Reichenbachiella ulvae]|uniref:Tetratricopeptide repeat-containing protein n=1 Tax=Reichenbachiella ulvae TaxID=2980104 RepID=A0ABT3CR23_9BACT|nr:hypothetical protein [Reichenbachiella ulvae]MCV9385944.1 hypothetical protein [Reichenbachiella ulvae]